MNVAELLLPNLDMSLVWGIVLVVFGMLVLGVSMTIPFNAVRKFIQIIGWAFILGGGAYWILASFFSDLLVLMSANIEWTVGVVLILLSFILIFRDNLIPAKGDSKNGKKR
jgi:hypothetical protein